MKESFLFLYTITVGGLGSGFQHGWNAGVLNAPSQEIQDWIGSLNLTYYETETQKAFFWGFIQSIFTVGGIIGGFISPVMIFVGGRKGGLMINDVLAITAGIVMYICKFGKTPILLAVGRCLAGINCGANGALCNIYLTEISPRNLRGAVGSLYQLWLTFALMLVMVFGIEPVLGSKEMWFYLFIFVTAMGIFQLLFLIPCPESPVYILDRYDNDEKARKAFNRLHGKKPNADAEYEGIKTESAANKAQIKLSAKVFCSQKIYMKPLGLCIFLMIAQQMTGINAVIFYSTDIFNKAGLSILDSQLCTVAIGIINFIATITAVLIIDKTGRKPLLFYGMIIMSLSTAALIGFLYLVDKHDWARWLCLVFILIFIIAFAIGAGPIPWMFGAEVFLANARPVAYSILIPTNWFFNLVVTLIFPPLQDMMGPLVFTIFLVCQLISILIIWFWIPETKNRNIEEIIQTEFS